MKKNIMSLIFLSLALLCLSACSGAGDKAMSKQPDSVPVSDGSQNETASAEPEEAAAVVATPDPEPAESETPAPTPDLAPQEGILIQYAGNSCFYIVFPDGTRLVSDPYGSRYASSFAPFPNMDADVVTLSHRHADHTGGLYELKGDPQIIYPERLNETINVGSVEIVGYPSKHVKKGSSLGDNTVFIYRYDDYKIVNMGETDLIESEDALKAVKDADVLLMYAGEYGAVKNDEIFKFAEDMGIKVLIPQHYSMDPDALWYGEPSIDMILSCRKECLRSRRTNL